MRIGGLATGIDTQQLVNDLMKVERMRVDRLQQDKQVLQWQQQDYREINNALRSLRDSAFSMKLQGTFLAKTAVSSNEAAVTVSAGANAFNGTYNIQITQLAAGVNRGSQVALADEAGGTGPGGVKTLSEQFTGITGTVAFTLAGKDATQAFSFDAATKTIHDVVTEINNANLGINAAYDVNLNRFFLTTATTGGTAKIEATGDTNNFLSGATNTLNLNLQTGVAATGTNAMINLGDAHHLEFNTNTFTVNGINITANQVMTTAGTITVASDVDTVVDSIKSFIELYNTTIGKVNQELLENRDRDYRPLTDAQREQMSETQQEQWEEIARSGLLRNDALLSSTVHRMRGAMSAMVSGLTNTLYDTLSEIGINTQNFQERGKLHIDEDRLRVALEADPEAMTALFTTSSTDYAQMGIAQRLQHDLDHHINLLTGRAGTDGSFVQFDSSAMGRRISNVNDEINRWEERLIALEDRHWRQFSAMERAINQMNQQSMWLAQQFGGGM